MLCEKCHKNNADVYITEVTPQGQIKHYFCKNCVSELNLLAEKNNIFSIDDFLSSIFNHNISMKETLKNKQICPNCQLSYEDFKHTGKLGCSICYETFSAQLEPLLHRIQGTSVHKGKIPRRMGGNLSLKQEITQLRHKILKHIEAEEYEQAAILRDKIKLLERQIAEKEIVKQEGEN